MDWTVNVTVHESASPGHLRKRIAQALADGTVHPSLLYSGVRQTSRWIQLHQSVSPAQSDPACIGVYNEAFSHIAQNTAANVLHVISLGCGDGSKDTNCLRHVREVSKAGIYTPCDLSLEMVLTAHENSTSSLRGLQSNPLLCELNNCSIFPAILKSFDPSGTERLVMFLGTLHNYHPHQILRSLLHIVRSQDQFLLSANLAPSSGYEASVKNIISQYDNPPTRHWLWGALTDFEIDETHGDLNIELVPTKYESSLKTIQASFTFKKPKSIKFLDQQFRFRAGQSLRLFTSTRFTSQFMESLFHSLGLSLISTWITPSEQEGLYLCRRKL